MRTIGFKHELSVTVRGTIGPQAIGKALVFAVLGTALMSTTSGARAQTSSVQAAQATSNVRQILPGSSDGEKIRYSVQCLDRTWGTVSVKEGQDSYCVTALRGKERCDKNWSLQQAGRSACEAGSK